MRLHQCRHCRAWVDPVLGALPPACAPGGTGTVTSPRAPGDHADCCHLCCYGHDHCRDRGDDGNDEIEALYAELGGGTWG